MLMHATDYCVSTCCTWNNCKTKSVNATKRMIYINSTLLILIYYNIKSNTNTAITNSNVN